VVTVVIAIVALLAPTVVMVARVVVAVVVDALSPPSGLDGVPRIAVGPKAALNR
jgi:hypothetical protein